MTTSQPTPIALPPVEKLAFPFHIANLQYDLDLAKSMLGDPTHRDWVDGLGDADYWAFAYPCGLRIAYEYIEPLGTGMAGYANMFADLPEIEHAIRHLPFPTSLQTPSTLDANSREIEAFSEMEPWAAPLATITAFQVWRQGDDGNAMPVGHPTSERDAKCWVAELESHGHKKTYWYDRS